MLHIGICPPGVKKLKARMCLVVLECCSSANYMCELSTSISFKEGGKDEADGGRDLLKKSAEIPWQSKG